MIHTSWAARQEWQPARTANSRS